MNISRAQFIIPFIISGFAFLAITTPLIAIYFIVYWTILVSGIHYLIDKLKHS
jgi:hypothetical protein